MTVNKAGSFLLPSSEKRLHFSLKPRCDSRARKHSVTFHPFLPALAPDISPSRARSSNARWISAVKTTFSLRSLPLRTNKHGQSIVGGRVGSGTERTGEGREREVIIYNHAITNSLLCAAKFVPARCYSVRRVRPSPRGHMRNEERHGVRTDGRGRAPAGEQGRKRGRVMCE